MGVAASTVNMRTLILSLVVVAVSGDAKPWTVAQVAAGEPVKNAIAEGRLHNIGVITNAAEAGVTHVGAVPLSYLGGYVPTAFPKSTTVRGRPRPSPTPSPRWLPVRLPEVSSLPLTTDTTLASDPWSLLWLKSRLSQQFQLSQQSTPTSPTSVVPSPTSTTARGRLSQSPTLSHRWLPVKLPEESSQALE